LSQPNTSKGEPSRQPLLDAEELAAELSRIADEIAAGSKKGQPDVFVGIETRGVPFAQRIQNLTKERLPNLEMGSLDISLYRDDLDNLAKIPTIRGSKLPVSIEGARVVLFDDVLFSGRTIRAAIDALMDYGRPARIELAVIVDRGNRELPIAASTCGLVIETDPGDHVSVHFTESDEQDVVYLTKNSKSKDRGKS